MSSSITLTLLGTITVPLAVAPFQVPLSLPGYTAPFMANGTGVNGENAFGGYFGLTYTYPQQLSTQPTNTTDMGTVFQFAGGTINSFGVFDFYSGPYPGVRTSPYSGGVVNNPTIYDYVQTVDGFYVYADTAPNGDLLPGIIRVNKVSMPQVLFANTVTNGGFSSNSLTYHTSGAAGNLITSLSPVYFDLFNGYQLVDPGSVFIPSGGGLTASSVCHALSGTSAATIPPYRANVIQNGVLTQAGVVVTNGTTSLTAAAAWSPNTGNYLVRIVGGQLAYVRAFTGTPTQGDGNTQFNDNTVKIAFSDAGDNALMDTGPNSDAAAPYCTIPSGDFLCAPNKPTVPNTSNVLYLIKGDMSGYYRVLLSGAPAWSYFTSGGFGVDLNGNFWIFGPGHVLYSNLGLGFSLFLGTFPNLQSNAVGCRRNSCNYSWFG